MSSASWAFRASSFSFWSNGSYEGGAQGYIAAVCTSIEYKPFSPAVKPPGGISGGSPAERRRGRIAGSGPENANALCVKRHRAVLFLGCRRGQALLSASSPSKRPAAGLFARLGKFFCFAVNFTVILFRRCYTDSSNQRGVCRRRVCPPCTFSTSYRRTHRPYAPALTPVSTAPFCFAVNFTVVFFRRCYTGSSDQRGVCRGRVCPPCTFTISSSKTHRPHAPAPAGTAHFFVLP